MTKPTEEMILKGIEAVKSHPYQSREFTEHYIRLAIIGALSPIVYRAHADTRVSDRRQKQIAEQIGKGYYRIGTDSYHPNYRGTGKDKRKTKRVKK